MEIKSQVNGSIIIEHPTVKGLFVKLTTTSNSVKAECFNRHMTITDYETGIYKHGGPVYFFNGKPTFLGKLQNTEYFEDMKKGLAEKALELKRREKALKAREDWISKDEKRLQEDNEHVCKTVEQLCKWEERVLQREADLDKRENALDMVADGIRRTTTHHGVSKRAHPEDKLVFKLADGNLITLRRKNLDHVVWVKGT